MKKSLLAIFLIFAMAVFSMNSAWAVDGGAMDGAFGAASSAYVQEHANTGVSDNGEGSKDLECFLPEYANSFSGCIFCPMFEKIYAAAQIASRSAAKLLGGPFANLLVIGIALFIAFHTLKLVTSFSQTDSKKYIQTIGVQFFKMMTAFLLLKNLGELYNLVINPLLDSGLEMGSAMIGGSTGTSSAQGTTTLGFSGSIGAKLVAFVELCQKSLAQICALGRYFLCLSWADRHWWFIPNFPLLFNGIILVVLSFFIILSFGFLLIDAVIQMSIVGSLVPLAVASWPFKITSKPFVKPVWGMFVGVFLTFAFAGVTVSVVKNLVVSSIKLREGGEGNATQRSFDELYKYLSQGQKLEDVLNELDVNMTSVMITLACAVIAWRLCGKIDDLVGKFDGDSHLKIGSGLGETAASVAKSLGKTAAQGAAKVGTGVKNAGKKSIKRAWDKITS